MGIGKDVTINFTMANGAINKPVTISLEGMTYNGATEFTYTPSQQSVTLTGLKTTTDTDPVSFTLNAENYNIYGPVEGSRLTYQFKGAFAATSLKAEADIKVDFTFNISYEAFETLKSLYPDAGANGVPMYVILERLHPADDQLVYSQARAEGDRYIYRIKQAGKQTIKLATTNADVGDCTVTLQADYFDTETVEIKQSNIVTYAGTINVTDANLNFGNNNNLQTDYNYSSSATYSITVGDKELVTNKELTSYKTSTTRTGTTNNRKYYITGINSFTIENVSISGEGINEGTTVKIEITITANNNSRTVTYSKTINELGLEKQ